MDVDDFICRWEGAPVGERGQYQTFIGQICRVIGVEAPDEHRAGDLDYCFERPVRFVHDDGSAHCGFIDCYRAGGDFQSTRVGGSGPAARAERPAVPLADLPDIPDTASGLASVLLMALRDAGVPVQPRTLALGFGGSRTRRMENRIEQTLAVLAVAGSVQRTQAGWFAPRRAA